jgi:hypothetical protein
MISVNGNLYSVPDSTRRTVEVHLLAEELRIAEENRLVASHPVLEGCDHRRVAGRHRRASSPDSRAAVITGAVLPARPGETILRRQLALHTAVAALGEGARPVMRDDGPTPATLGRVRRHLIGLRIPRALELLDY